MFFELIVALSVTTTVSQAGMPYMPNLVFKVVVAAVVLFSPFDVLSAIDCVFEYRQPKMNSYCVFARNELRFCLSLVAVISNVPYYLKRAQSCLVLTVPLLHSDLVRMKDHPPLTFYELSVLSL